MRPVSLLPKTPKGRLSFMSDLLQAQVVSAHSAFSRSFPQLRDIDPAAADKVRLLDERIKQIARTLPAWGMGGWGALIYSVPDTIFLTRDERRTHLEKITMKERDEKRMKNWVFG